MNDRGSRLLFQVPTDLVRHYFLLDDPAKRPELRALVRRLQRMDVAVYRLTAPLTVPDFKPYGRSVRSAVLPAGTYWIPMAQQEKHWIQGMLNEDTYVAFPYFYDISGWSNPLLSNVDGGRSGAFLGPSAQLVAPVSEPPPPVPPGPIPSIAVLRTSNSANARQSAGWLAYLFERVWHLPYTWVTAADIAGGGLTGYDVLIATQGDPIVASNALGPSGRQALASWLNAGGRYLGFAGGAVLAGRLGLTTNQFADPHSDIAGTLIRVNVDDGSPLASGVGDQGYVFYNYDPVIHASDPRFVMASYPAAGSPDFYVSGFADGEEELGGTAAITDEPAGLGRVVLFSSDPNFRAYTAGMQKVLWNALFGADPWAGQHAKLGSPRRLDSERTAIAAARNVTEAGFAGIRLTVRPGGAERAQRLLKGLGAHYRVLRSPDRVSFLVANPNGAESGLALRLGPAVRRSGVQVVAFAVS